MSNFHMGFKIHGQAQHKPRKAQLKFRLGRMQDHAGDELAQHMFHF